MESYVAVIRKAPATLSLEFPDLPRLTVKSGDLNDARAKASVALRARLVELEENGRDPPAASSFQAVMEALFVKGLGTDFNGLVEIEAAPPPAKTVRVNISLEEAMLARIDRAAAARHMTRSGYLAELARADMERHRITIPHFSAPKDLCTTFDETDACEKRRKALDFLAKEEAKLEEKASAQRAKALALAADGFASLIERGIDKLVGEPTLPAWGIRA